MHPTYAFQYAYTCIHILHLYIHNTHIQLLITWLNTILETIGLRAWLRHETMNTLIRTPRHTSAPHAS